MIICEAPIVAAAPTLNPAAALAGPKKATRYPLGIAARPAKSLTTYVEKLLKLVKDMEADPQKQKILGSLAFNLNRQRNPSHQYFVAFTVSQLSELRAELEKSSTGVNSLQILSKHKPVVLAFGGQVGNTIGLPIDVFNSSVRLRLHLNQYEEVLRHLGLPSLFPGVFIDQPVQDVVSLHTMLFAVQYSFAKTWIDCGLHVDTIVGHSFGQITALSVCGSLSLEDGLKLIAGRAALMQTMWGPERGSMIAIEANGDTVSEILATVNAKCPGKEVEIACYNGVTSHVLVGS